MKHELAVVLLFGMLAGMFFTNGVWLFLSFESIINIIFGLLVITGLIIKYK